MIDFPETISSLDENTATPRVSLTYPYIRIVDPTDALALIIPSLPKGDLPLVMTYKGVTRVVGKITKSAIEINKLTKLSRLEFVKSPNTATPLNCGMDILDLGVI